MKKNNINSNNNTNGISRRNNNDISLTLSTALLNRKIGIMQKPRMLTKYEIDLLRKSKKEIIDLVGEILKNKDKTLKNKDKT